MLLVLLLDSDLEMEELDNTKMKIKSTAVAVVAAEPAALGASRRTHRPSSGGPKIREESVSA